MDKSDCSIKINIAKFSSSEHNDPIESVSKINNFITTPIVVANESLESNDKNNDDDNVEQKKSKNLNKRCNFSACNKKLGLMSFDCKCGYKFCGIHKYNDSHNCSYDHKNDDLKQLENKLIKVVADKINKI
jgi:hypothetical protein